MCHSSTVRAIEYKRNTAFSPVRARKGANKDAFVNRFVNKDEENAGEVQLKCCASTPREAVGFRAAALNWAKSLASCATSCPKGKTKTNEPDDTIVRRNDYLPSFR